MSDKRSWREIDRGRDKEEYRGQKKSKGGANVSTATAQYKQSLNAFFDRGVVPEHLKGKLGDAATGEHSERQKLLRKIRDASTNAALKKSLDTFLKSYELPEDPEIWLRALEHPEDRVLSVALDALESYLDKGQILKRKAVFVQRLKGLEFVSFDPRVQQRAARLAGRLS